MKTRTLASLVFALPVVGLMASVETGQPPASNNAQDLARPAPSVEFKPAPPPRAAETARVVLLTQPENQLPRGISLSGWVGELVKLAGAGLGEEVLLSFVDSAGTFNLDADQIIYLHDIGLSSEVITTVIRHDVEITSGLRQVTAGAPPMQFAFKKADFPADVTPLKSETDPPNDSVPGEAEQAMSTGRPGDFDWSEPAYAAQEPQTDEVTAETSPVRKPYPVQLTSPILVFRACGRAPNTILLHNLP